MIRCMIIWCFYVNNYSSPSYEPPEDDEALKSLDPQVPQGIIPPGPALLPSAVDLQNKLTQH